MDRAVSGAGRHPRAIGFAWFVGALTTVTGGYALVAARNPGFFLVDDIESSELPVMSHLGGELRNGTWPWVTERNWTVGLVAGDPQYGLFNPVSLLSYWVLDPIASLQWRVFLLVLFYVNMIAAGVFWAARCLGSSSPFAALAAVTAGLNLYVLYWNAAGWTSLLPGLAWFVVAVAALLAALERPDRPWRSVVAGVGVAMTFTAGAPFSLLAYSVTAAVLIGASLWAHRERIREFTLLLCALASGAIIGAVPWIVAMEYGTFARRPSGWYNNGFLTFHLEALLMSFTPSVRPFTGTFQGWKLLDQPVTYGSWLFAGAVALLWTRHVRLRAARLGVLLAGLVLFLGTLGPEGLGTFRWPFRLTPFALILLALAVVIVLEQAQWAPTRGSRSRRTILVAAGAVLTVLSFSLRPNLLVPLVTAIVLFVGVPLVLWCVRHRRPALLAITGMLSTVGIWTIIVLIHPETTDLIDLKAPGGIDLAQEDLRPLTGHRTLQLIEGIPAGSIRDVLANNYSMYGRDEAEFITGYSSLVPQPLGDLLCLSDNGYVCRDAPARLFRREPETGLRFVDLFGVSQIMVQKGSLLDGFEQARSSEWVPVAESDWWVMYQNGTRLGEAPVVWTSEGGTVEPVAESGYRVSLPAGGRLVLSRPIWPGTTVSVGGVEAELEPVADLFVGADFDRPVEGELSIGHVLPGRLPAAVAGAVGTAMLAGCAVAAFLASRRRRRASGPT